MAVNYVKGQILASNLERDGIDLSISNARVGIGTLFPSATLEVVGNVVIGNVSISNIGTITANGNITGGNLLTGGIISATGNITGGNLVAITAVISSSVSATGNINGGNLNAVSGVTAATGFFTGNVDVLGNLNATIGVVYANSGIFYGNSVTGNNAAFAGIPGYTPLGSNVVMQFAGNVNSYSQLNFQNVNAGNRASTDFIATADNGDDNNYYVDMGIASSTYDYPDFSGYEPNDAYLHNAGGNLILNPDTAGKTINFMVGGTGTADIIGTVSNTGLAITGIVSATGNIVGGNVSTVGTVSATGNIVGGNLSTAGNVTANYVIADSGLIGNVTIDDLNIGNVTANGFANIAGNVTGGNLITAGLITAVGNILGSGAVFSGNVTSNTFIGNIIGNTGTIGNLTFANTTIGTQLADGNITLSATGNSFVQIGGTYGLVVPAGNTAQRLGAGNVAGTVRFNTDVLRIEVYDGTEWDQIVSGVTSQTLNGDGSTVAFTLDRASTPAAALIMLNGVVQRPGFAYNITPSPSTNLTFTEAPAVGDVIDIRYL